MADLLPNTIRILRGALWPSLPWAALFFAAFLRTGLSSTSFVSNI